MVPPEKKSHGLFVSKSCSTGWQVFAYTPLTKIDGLDTD